MLINQTDTATTNRPGQLPPRIDEYLIFGRYFHKVIWNVPLETMCPESLPNDLQFLLSNYSFNSFVTTMLLVLAIIGLASATCFLANGTADSAPYIAQCPPDFSSQMCCWLVNLPNPDSCTTQGICLSNYSGGGARKYVDGCTDPDWGSECSPLGKLCRRLYHFLFTLIFQSLMRNRVPASNTAGYVEVTICPDDSVCCGDSNSGCCNDDQGYKINAKGQLQGSPVTPTAESSATASSITALSITASSIPAVGPRPSQSSANNQTGGSTNVSNKELAYEVAFPTVAIVIALLAWWLPRRPR